jgi:hypothetical protein
MLSMVILFFVTLVIQIQLFNLKIEDISAGILLSIELAISVFISYIITKWQNRYLDTKSLKTSYLFLALLILLAIIALPIPFIYTEF